MGNVCSLILYLLVFIFSGFVFYIYRVKKHKLTKRQVTIMYLIIMSLPVLIATLRNGVGTDYYEYKSIYYNLANMKISFNVIFFSFIEPLFVILNYISLIFLKSHYVLFFNVSLIIIFFGIRGIDLLIKDNRAATLGVVIFFLLLYPISLNVMRQVISISILIYSLHFMFQYKNKQFYFFVLLAFLFHKSSVIALIFPLIYRYVNNKKFKIMYVLMLVIIILLFPIWKYVLTIIFNFLNRNYYLKSTSDFSFGFLMYFIPEFLYLVTNYKNMDEKTKTLFYIFLLQIPFQILSSFISVLDRFSLFSYIPRILIFPLLLKKDKYFKLKLIFLLMWFLFYHIMMYMILGGQEIYPYKF